MIEVGFQPTKPTKPLTHICHCATQTSQYAGSMPGIETAPIVVALAGAVYPLLGRTLSRPLRAFYIAIAALALSGQLYLVGAHWQMYPAYAALVLMTWVIWHHQPGGAFRLLALAADALCLTTVAALWIFPMFTLPRPTGPYPVGTTGPISWTDSSRNIRGDATSEGPRRELVVQIWYPAAPTSRSAETARYARFKELSLAHSYLAAIRTNSFQNAPIEEEGSPYPVLIFGHRWGGSRTQNTFLTEDLASHGYIVVAVDHPLNAARTLLSDGTVLRSDRANTLSNLEATSASATKAAWGKELDLWAADDRFVLDSLSESNATRFANRLDMTRVGAVGHSFGGSASFNLLGRDPRVKSAVNLDGWTFQGLDRRTGQPMLVVYEGAAATPQPQTGIEGALNTDDTSTVEASLKRFGGTRAYVAGTQHLDFTDQTLFSPLQRLTFTGPIAGIRAREITRSLVLSFFNQTLRNIGEIPTYPEVKMEYWPAIK